MMRIHAVMAAAALLVAAVTSVDAADSGDVGQIKIAEGKAIIVRGDNRLAAKPGDGVRVSDGLETGGDGSMGLTLKDNTVLSLGPDSEFLLEDFAFEPQQARLTFVARMLKGTFTYLSGHIASLSPQAVSIATPVSIIGIRGTKILVKVDP